MIYFLISSLFVNHDVMDEILEKVVKKANKLKIKYIFVLF